MKAGKKRHLVQLQSPAGSRDAVGERVTTWTTVASVWAAIEPIGARELFAAAQAQAATTHRVRVDYSTAIAAIDGSWRVLFGSRVLVIDGKPRNIEERNREIELLCSEGLRAE